MYRRFRILSIIRLVLNANVGKAKSYEEYLEVNNADVSVRLNHYDTERYNYLINSKSSNLKDKTMNIDFMDSKWPVKKSIFKAKVEGQYKIELRFECVDGQLNDAFISCDLHFNNWSENNYILLPAAVYNGNRYPKVQMNYMPFFSDSTQVRHLGRRTMEWVFLMKITYGEFRSSTQELNRQNKRLINRKIIIKTIKS